VAFLKYSQKDTLGTANPLASHVKHTTAVGYSQTGRLLKTILVKGFNAMDGKRIFDGMHFQAAHAGLLPVMQTGTGPVSSCNAFPPIETVGDT